MQAPQRRSHLSIVARASEHLAKQNLSQLRLKRVVADGSQEVGFELRWIWVQDFG